MGRIKGAAIKALAEHMIVLNPTAFFADFAETKKVLDQLELGMGKTEKNKLAGEISMSIAKLDKLAMEQEEEDKRTAALKAA